MKEIKLINSDQKAQVDDEDYNWLTKYSDWYLAEDGYVRSTRTHEEMGSLVYAKMQDDKLRSN